jgi:hypothetical protein
MACVHGANYGSVGRAGISVLQRQRETKSAIQRAQQAVEAWGVIPDGVAQVREDTEKLQGHLHALSTHLSGIGRALV